MVHDDSNRARDQRFGYAGALLGVAATSLPEWDCQHLRNEATRSDLGMSRTTVKKHWLSACGAAGIADVRTGNHNPFLLEA